VRVLDEASFFHKSCHFRRRNIRGFKQDLRYVKVVIHPIVSLIFEVFLGLVGYYTNFIEGFLNTTKPMIKLLRKDEMFKWTPAVKLDFRN
jgi:hypothetical protein